MSKFLESFEICPICVYLVTGLNGISLTTFDFNFFRTLIGLLLPCNECSLVTLTDVSRVVFDTSTLLLPYRKNFTIFFFLNRGPRTVGFKIQMTFVGSLNLQFIYKSSSL